jgi:hypothetical protein
MLTAMVLICAISGPMDLAHCNRDTALDVILVPDSFANPVTCFLHGQAYVAQAMGSRMLAAGDQLKVVCAPVDIARARQFNLNGSQARE